jgi:hypothetical protein
MRMRLEIQLATPSIGYVGVQLRCREVGVAEHLLDAAQVRSTLEEMRRIRVSEQVRVDARSVEPGFRS